MATPDVFWSARVFGSRWRNRLHYAVAAPIVYENWWEMYVAKLRGRPTLLRLRDGTKYFVRPQSTDLGVINELAFRGDYFRGGYVTLRRDSHVVDVGANIGDFAVHAAWRAPAGRVIAIEPVAANCECLRTNVRLNHLSNVTVLELALGGREGRVGIHQAGVASSAVWGEGETQDVRVATLEAVLDEQRMEVVDLLKLDCEGAEWDLLPAAEGVLPRIRQICMEYHNGTLTADWLQPWLERHGFTVWRTQGTWNGFLWARRD